MARDISKEPDVLAMLDQVTITNLDDVANAALALRQIALDRDMRVAVWGDISVYEPMVDANGANLNTDYFGWQFAGTDRWWEDHQLALHSPAPMACRYINEPFWCNRLGFYGCAHNEYLEEIDLRCLFKKGEAAIIVPVHMPFGQISANSVCPLIQGKGDLSEEFAAYGALFDILIRKFITGYSNVRGKHRPLPSDSSLTKREVECLRWAAAGKTDKEIGMIMSLSHATVRYHICRASEKLNAVKRAQVVLKANQLGYI